VEAEEDVLTNRQMREEREVLGNVTDSATLRPLVGYLPAIEKNPSLFRGANSQNSLQQECFTRSGGP
jgi:hypothetical protein